MTNFAPPPPWMAEAACDEHTADLFYPDHGEPGHAMARHICRSCPVINECLNYALETNQTWGIWGGLGPESRRKLKVARAA